MGRTPAVSILVSVLLFAWSVTTLALEADDMEELLGYTMVAHSNVAGEFEGADFDKLVKLDNGMVFEFNEYSYSYAYRPGVAVFAKKLEIKTKSLTLHKLVIDDEIYDAVKVR